jgi:hypothetical protein
MDSRVLGWTQRVWIRRWEASALRSLPADSRQGFDPDVWMSFAAGLPCASPISAEGVPLGGLLRGFVGETYAALADLILSLHADPDRNHRCSQECEWCRRCSAPSVSQRPS